MGKKKEDFIITLEELEAALGDYPDHVRPDGFLTAKEWSKEWGTSLRTAQMRISEATDAGIVKMRKYRRKSIDGGSYTAAHYRISPSPAPSPRKTGPAP